MDCISIVGGVPLRGCISISGAKNAVLPLMAVSLLTDQPLILENIPFLDDVTMMRRLLESLGTEITCFHKRLVLRTEKVTSWHADYEIVRKMRASILALGPLVARCGKAEVSMPGGCALGARLVNYHLEALACFGADIDIVNGYICAQVPSQGLVGNKYTFPRVTVTGTMNALLAATAARGESCIENVAMEPEVGDLIACLSQMGALIEGQGTSTLYVQGQRPLSGTHYHVLPDRIEMGTYMIAAAMTQGDVVLEGGDLALLPGVAELMRSIGIGIEIVPQGVRVFASGRPQPFSLQTEPFPGFPTDLQAQIMALATLADGQSKITETMYENRFMHVPELIRLGANITIDGSCAVVTGVPALCGAPVMATDLRASFSLILAGLVAEGTTLVRRVYHLDRGYERAEEKLSACGATITRLTSEPVAPVMETASAV